MTATELIQNLREAIENNNEARITEMENQISHIIGEVYELDSFYSLPLNSICSIVSKTDFIDENEPLTVLKTIIERTDAIYGENSHFLLKSIKNDSLPPIEMKDCIDILSKFKHIELCNKLSELQNEENQLLEVDKDYEIDQLRKEIETLRNQNDDEHEVDDKNEGEDMRICPVIVAGDPHIGKSTLLKQIGQYASKNTAPEDLKFFKCVHNNVSYPIISVSSSVYIRAIIKNLDRQYQILIFTYAVTDSKSFGHVMADIILKIRENKLLMILVGIVDENKPRVVTFEQGRNIAEKFNMEFFETTFKHNEFKQKLFSIIDSKVDKSLLPLRMEERKAKKEEESSNGCRI